MLFACRYLFVTEASACDILAYFQYFLLCVKSNRNEEALLNYFSCYLTSWFETALPEF